MIYFRWIIIFIFPSFKKFFPCFSLIKDPKLHPFPSVKYSNSKKKNVFSLHPTIHTIVSWDYRLPKLSMVDTSIDTLVCINSNRFVSTCRYNYNLNTISNNLTCYHKSHLKCVLRAVEPCQVFRETHTYPILWFGANLVYDQLWYQL